MHKVRRSISVTCICTVLCVASGCNEVAPDVAPPGKTQIEDSFVAEALQDTERAAFGGSMDGQLLYEKACASCHDEGFNGAPRLLAEDWPNADIIGPEVYAQIAIAGVGIMPPRAGQPDMTDDQIRAAVEYILERIR